MEFIDKLLKKPLWVNILAGIGLVLVLLIVFFFSLGWITGNGKTEKVPNVIGLDVTAAEKNIKALGFDLVLQDSIYVDTLARNSILRQTPEADEVVKKGRTIFHSNFQVTDCFRLNCNSIQLILLLLFFPSP